MDVRDPQVLLPQLVNTCAALGIERVISLRKLLFLLFPIRFLNFFLSFLFFFPLSNGLLYFGNQTFIFEEILQSAT